MGYVKNKIETKQVIVGQPTRVFGIHVRRGRKKGIEIAKIDVRCLGWFFTSKCLSTDAYHIHVPS